MKRILTTLLLVAAVLAGCTTNDKTMNSDSLAQRTFMQLAGDRFACRSFSDRVIPDELLNQVLEAGRLAPTACNFQPQRIYVIKTPEALAKLNEAYVGSTYGAPVVLLFAYDDNIVWHNTLWENGHTGAIDASIVATHCMMEAEDLGLNTVWCGATNNKAIEAAIGLPENEHSVLLMPIGYKSDDCKPAPMHTDRKPLEETVIFK